MYFWTNTPNQVALIGFAAQVNSLNAHINDPNISEDQASAFQQQFGEAKVSMHSAFTQVFLEWADWLDENLLAFPTMRKDGTINALALNTNDIAISLRSAGAVSTYNGQQYFWEDFYRMLALQAFILRLSPEKTKGAYRPEDYFNE